MTVSQIYSVSTCCNALKHNRIILTQDAMFYETNRNILNVLCITFLNITLQSSPTVFVVSNSELFWFIAFMC